MLTFENLKEFFILFFTFGIIYLFQYVDDKKRCKKRDGIYDNVKLPLLASAIVGLVLFWNIDSGATFMNYTPAPGALRAPSVNFPGPNLPASGLGISKVNPDFVLANQTGGHIPAYNIDCAANNLEVYTDFPEWG
jgi:hypothetical protein